MASAAEEVPEAVVVVVMAAAAVAAAAVVCGCTAASAQRAATITATSRSAGRRRIGRAILWGVFVWFHRRRPASGDCVGVWAVCGCVCFAFSSPRGLLR